MLDPSTPSMSKIGISSTAFADRLILIRRARRHQRTDDTVATAELLYFPTLSDLLRSDVAKVARAPSRRERNESDSWHRVSNENSNRKDRRKGGARLLLIGSNAPRIRLFADSVRHRSDTADGQVMDRGAECAAGGNDAV